jgi:hypothetical protein
MDAMQIQALDGSIQKSLNWWSHQSVGTTQQAYSELESFHRKLRHIQHYMQTGKELEDCILKQEALLRLVKVRAYDKQRFMEDALQTSRIKNSKKTGSKNTTDEDLVSAAFYSCLADNTSCALVTQDTDITNLSEHIAEFYATKDPALYWTMQQYPIKVYRYHKGKARFQVEFDSRRL